MAKSGFHLTKSAHVDAPLIEELPVAMECTLVKVNEDGNIIGKIENVSVDERVLDATAISTLQNSVRSHSNRRTRLPRSRRKGGGRLPDWCAVEISTHFPAARFLQPDFFAKAGFPARILLTPGGNACYTERV